ncbi:MAG: C40 family peptidase [Yaniella sp.]|uniref:C40 family peptidase n=1 Tax=Yaniella sp. TaxID=2773929 RepID=UPI0026491E4E|nr:C40 family peptidase [Yaniella sp.]MDN5730500.1 C40 family peptidase [Yaniella sp.]MDN5742009.1 C40 family peptidase [Yaniella sp.]MDN5817170.1 C40 family peptidase [Yaniella sp.]MDN5837152.1 C40 family peptidase [Yaniella sp.]MDN5888431.1 C40 family peptidase [Yaniella sp.]
MSKRISTARHRATPEKGATLGAMTQVIGRSGRQAAVLAAASGMVLAVPPAANAAPVQTDRETSTLPATNFKLERTSRNADVISAEPGTLSLNRADIESEHNEPEPAPETESTEEADLAPVTRETADETSTETQNETQSETETASTTETQEAPAPSSSGSLGAVVSAAYSGVGTPYVWGGKGPGGWDCSGFTAWAYAQAGINIPSSTSAILGSGQFARTSSPQPGDLVFQNGGGHVGIYVGNGQMIGAQNPSTGTILHDVTRNPLMGYYTYTG